MKKFSLIILVLLITLLCGFANVSKITPIKYTNYYNDRYEFSIDYPTIFKVDVIPDNNDGRIFISKDRLSRLTVSGGNNVTFQTIDSSYKNEISEHKNISYKSKHNNWYVISWSEGNKIFYEKSVIGEGSINTFILEYPKNQNDYYKQVISRLVSSFKTPGLKDCH